MRIFAALSYFNPPPTCCSNRPSQRKKHVKSPTIEKLHSMKLHGMATPSHAQMETADMSQLGSEERFALLVGIAVALERERALARRLRERI